MKKPVVLFVTQTAHPWGGVETWLERIVGALEGDGWRVVVGLVEGRRHHDPEAYLAQHAYRESLVIPCRTGTSEGRVRAVRRALERVQPDIVVPVNVCDVFEAVRRVKLRALGPRLLAAIHGFGLAQLHDLAAHRGLVDRAIAVNRLLHLALSEVAGLEPARTAYVPGGAAQPNSEPAVKSGAFRVAWIGRLCQEYKRAGTIVPVAAALEERGCDFHLDVVGSGPMKDELVRAVSVAGLDRRVTFRGYLPAEELYRSVYPGLGALLLTSDAEGGPIVAWEAMLHGAVVVTTRYLGLEVEGALVNGQTALVAEPGDVRGLADGIAAIAGDSNLRERIGSAGREKARERYVWDRVLKSWVGEFHACMADPMLLPSRQSDMRRTTSGRLDAWLGIGLGEILREALGLGMEHQNPGGEWPHICSPEAIDEEVRATFSAIEERLRSSPS